MVVEDLIVFDFGRKMFWDKAILDSLIVPEKRT
jgi:hypothetical protein